MEAYKLDVSETTPEIILDPGNNRFSITGSSRPEDVRSFYYPIIEWFAKFKEELASGAFHGFTEKNPLVFNSRLEYFNSASAKFLYDIFIQLKEIAEMEMNVVVNWFYDEEDEDMQDAGEEMAELVEMEFNLIGEERD